MPEEFSRTTKRKRVRLPGGSEVDIPVITKISFIDPFNQYQEYEYSIENGADGLRQVHVDDVPSSENGEVVGDDTLSVERIDKWSHSDVFDRNQETELSMDNVTGSELIPPHFFTHLTTHVVRYRGTEGEASAWIDSELIDSFSVIDPISQYQERIFTLNNPQTNDEAQANIDDPDITDSANGIDPPWRTDPFQNIVNFKGEDTTDGTVHVRVGVSVPAQVIFQGGIGGDLSAGGGALVENGTVALQTFVFNTSTNSWAPAGGSLTGVLSGVPATQGGNKPASMGTPPFAPFYSFDSTGIASFGVNDGAGIFLGPFGPVDFSGCVFTVSGTPGRVYTFDSIIVGSESSGGGVVTNGFAAILGFNT